MIKFKPEYHKKLQEYVFLNLAYLLKQSREAIKFEHPQYGDPNLGFAITMFRVDHKAYDYAYGADGDRKDIFPEDKTSP